MNRILTLLFIIILNANTVNAQNWQTNFEQAKEIATKENKTIVLVFQGSDWCAPCIKLDHEIWSSVAFKKYAEEHYVMLQADFPKKKKNALPKEQKETNGKLFEKYNKNGIFPFVVIMDSKGNKLGETSYKKTTPENYIKEINSFLK